MHANTRLKPARQANKSSDLEIIYRPLSELKLDPTNPRLRSKKKKKNRSAKSTKASGFSEKLPMKPTAGPAARFAITRPGRKLISRSPPGLQSGRWQRASGSRAMPFGGTRRRT